MKLSLGGDWGWGGFGSGTGRALSCPPASKQSNILVLDVIDTIVIVVSRSNFALSRSTTFKVN